MDGQTEHAVTGRWECGINILDQVAMELLLKLRPQSVRCGSGPSPTLPHCPTYTVGRAMLRAGARLERRKQEAQGREQDWFGKGRVGNVTVSEALERVAKQGDSHRNTPFWLVHHLSS